jgi:hemolysin activation/secretion protein
VSLRIGIALAAALLGCAASSAADELATATTVAVREIRVQDNELIPQAVLDSILPAYRNRQVSAQELQELAQKLTSWLVERGYVSSGVILPDQKVSDGVVTLKVVAGHVTEAVIAGNRRLRDGYISRRLGDVYSSPLNVNDIAGRLQVLEHAATDVQPCRRIQGRHCCVQRSAHALEHCAERLLREQLVAHRD